MNEKKGKMSRIRTRARTRKKRNWEEKDEKEEKEEKAENKVTGFVAQGRRTHKTKKE